MNPTLAGFLDFLRTSAGINATVLPDDSEWITYAYNAALEVVQDGFIGIAPTLYTLAVYNLATDNLINWTPDQAGQTFFANARTSYGLGTFVPGIIVSASDEGTSASLYTPDFFSGLTIANLQSLKTPWGLQYLAFAQSWGNVWGLS